MCNFATFYNVRTSYVTLASRALGCGVKYYISAEGSLSRLLLAGFGVSLACRWWPNIESWLKSFVIFQGSGPIMLWNPTSLWFLGGGGPNAPPPMDPPMGWSCDILPATISPVDKADCFLDASHVAVNQHAHHSNTVRIYQLRIKCDSEYDF